MPSGATPNDIFILPSAYGGERCSIPVSQDAIDALRKDIGISHEDAFPWLEDEFAVKAEGVWEFLNKPKLTVGTGWQIFEQMVYHLIS